MLITNLGLVSSAETIIIGQNATPPQSLVLNESITFSNNNEGQGLNLGNISEEDFNKFVIAMDERTKLNERFFEYMVTVVNRSQKNQEDFNTNLGSVTSTIQDQNKRLADKDREVKTQEKQLLGLQNKVDKLYFLVPLYLLIGALSGIFTTRLYLIFRNSNKFYTFIRWVRGWYPFAIGPPEVEVGTSHQKKTKIPWFWITILTMIMFSVITLMVL